MTEGFWTLLKSAQGPSRDLSQGARLAWLPGHFSLGYERMVMRQKELRDCDILWYGVVEGRT